MGTIRMGEAFRPKLLPERVLANAVSAGRSAKSSIKRAWRELQSDDSSAPKRPHG